MRSFNRHLALALAVISTAGFAQAQPRTWGFAKDTVYEWTAPVATVDLLNSGATLAFDSISFEAIRPASPQHMQGQFYISSEPAASRYFLFSLGAPAKSSLSLTLDSNQTKSLSELRVESILLQVAKSSAALQSAAVVQGDTLAVRFIFHAAANRGKDTLVLVGLQDSPPSSIRRGPTKVAPNGSGVFYDLRGRRMENLPQGVRIPFRSVVTDGKKK